MFIKLTSSEDQNSFYHVDPKEICAVYQPAPGKFGTSPTKIFLKSGLSLLVKESPEVVIGRA